MTDAGVDVRGELGAAQRRWEAARREMTSAEVGRMAAVVAARSGGLTLSDIGGVLGLSKTRVVQLLRAGEAAKRP